MATADLQHISEILAPLGFVVPVGKTFVTDTEADWAILHALGPEPSDESLYVVMLCLVEYGYCSNAFLLAELIKTGTAWFECIRPSEEGKPVAVEVPKWVWNYIASSLRPPLEDGHRSSGYLVDPDSGEKFLLEDCVVGNLWPQETASGLFPIWLWQEDKGPHLRLV